MMVRTHLVHSVLREQGLRLLVRHGRVYDHILDIIPIDGSGHTVFVGNLEHCYEVSAQFAMAKRQLLLTVNHTIGTMNLAMNEF